MPSLADSPAMAKSPNQKSSSKKQTNQKHILYEYLGLRGDCSQADIKKAYYKLALECHPDRVKGDSDTLNHAKERFQQIGKAYEILSDPTKRKLYDERGIIENDGSEANWAEYFRELFKRVTMDDLDEFKANYVGSKEEYEDILAAYVKNKGDIAAVTDSIFFGDVDSEARYLSIIKQAIAKGIVPEFKKMAKIVSDEAAYKAQQRKRISRAAKEAVEAAEMAKELGLHGKGKDGLVAAIKGRSQGRFESLIASLESKYANEDLEADKPKKKKAKK